MPAEKMELDLSGLTPDEMEAFGKSFAMLADQPPLPDTPEAVRFSEKAATRMAVEGLFGVMTEEKYNKIFNMAVAEGFADSDAQAIVEHHRFADESLNALPQKVFTQVEYAVTNEIPIAPPKMGA